MAADAVELHEFRVLAGHGEPFRQFTLLLRRRTKPKSPSRASAASRRRIAHRTNRNISGSKINPYKNIGFANVILYRPFL